VDGEAGGGVDVKGSVRYRIEERIWLVYGEDDRALFSRRVDLSTMTMADVPQSARDTVLAAVAGASTVSIQALPAIDDFEFSFSFSFETRPRFYVVGASRDASRELYVVGDRGKLAEGKHGKLDRVSREMTRELAHATAAKLNELELRIETWFRSLIGEAPQPDDIAALPELVADTAPAYSEARDTRPEEF
jgi:hypothetical protein